MNVPPAFRITEKLPVPLTSWAAAGSEALASELRIRIVWVTAGTTFHDASQALTVTENGIPAVGEVGVPVLPEVVPGAAVSPGRRTWSRANAAALAGAAVNGAARRTTHRLARALRSARPTTNLLE